MKAYVELEKRRSLDSDCDSVSQKDELSTLGEIEGRSESVSFDLDIIFKQVVENRR